MTNMQAKQEFGGSWTENKLARVQRYLHRYMVILRKYPSLVPIYVDAFAGTGYRTEPSKSATGQLPLVQLAESDKEFLNGSARNALEVDPKFGRYIFVELSKRRVEELQGLATTFPDLASRIDIVRQDANAFLQSWCKQTDWRSHRAVVFLDPYGMQVEWSTIQCLAQTEAVDLWYLFPLSAVNRLLTRAARPRQSWIECLNRIYGSPDWLAAFYHKQRVTDLFGTREVEVKDTNFSRIAEFTMNRLKTAFPAVAPNPLVLLSENKSPLFLLCFAAASRQASTQKAALNIASHILKM